MSIRVLVNGAEGRMGQETVKAIEASDDLILVGTGGKDDDLSQLISLNQAEVVVDFTEAKVSFKNTLTIIEAGAHPVIGTSGFLPEHVKKLQDLAAERKLGGVIAPNFSIGAVLMMQCAEMIAKHLPDAEIIEMHHPNKLDAPSGTALKTAEMIAKARIEAEKTPTEVDTTDNTVAGARGALHQQVPIHSVRLPGLIAHQTVMFGGHYEGLCLKHDSFHRASFMPGVCLACRSVVAMNYLAYGLEKLL